MDRAWFCAYGLVVYVPVILLLGIYSHINEKPRNYTPIHNVQMPVKNLPETKTGQNNVKNLPETKTGQNNVKNLPETKTGQNNVITQGSSASYSYGKDYPIFDDYYRKNPSKLASRTEMNRYSICRKLKADKTSHNAHKAVVTNADEVKKWDRSKKTGRLFSYFTSRVS